IHCKISEAIHRNAKERMAEAVFSESHKYRTGTGSDEVNGSGSYLELLVLDADRCTCFLSIKFLAVTL
ncbi:hypothetical protein LOAG_04506, partial [Loa loa]